MTSIHRQQGSTLLVALIMLVLLTLIALSALSSTTASIRVVGNAQFREEATAAGQRAIEAVLSDGNFKTTPPGIRTIDINRDGVADYTVTFTPPPRCMSFEAADPDNPQVPSVCAAGAGIAAPCYWTVWDITASVSDVSTGANVILHQGVRTIAGLNAAVSSCGA